MSTTSRQSNIHIRAREADRDLIDKAAARLGKTRSEFIVETMRREATEVLQDEQHFVLSPQAWTAFIAELDRPPQDNPWLRELLNRKAPWDHDDPRA
jgi:uncharacterized protein (DUF1778 family)